MKYKIGGLSCDSGRQDMYERTEDGYTSDPKIEKVPFHGKERSVRVVKGITTLN